MPTGVGAHPQIQGGVGVSGLVVVAGAGEVVTALVPRPPGGNSGPMKNHTDTNTTDKPTGGSVADQDGAKSLKIGTEIKVGGPMLQSHHSAAATRSRAYVRLPVLGVLIALVLSILPGVAGAAQIAPVGPGRPPATDNDVPAVDPKILAERYGPLRFVVDPAVTPGTSTTDPVDGTRDVRQVGAIAFPDGSTADLVVDHVIFHAKSPAELDGFLGRWGGVVLESDEADDEGQQHMIKVDPSAADVAPLPANLLAVEPEHVGEHKVGDLRLLKLLALVAQEAAAGAEVTVSWMAESSEIDDGQVFEGSGIANPKNVFDWPYMNLGGPQDIGVARAWQLLEAEGKLDAQVRLLVNDGGFIPNTDSAEKWTLSYADVGESNSMDCTGGSDCPWHGTNVIDAAMAEVDNGYGSAGPAGPLASDVIAVGNGGDVWTQFRRVVRKVDQYRPKVVNMSWGYDTHLFKDAQEYSANRHLKKMNKDGALVVASAGNDVRNVDDDVLILPCESSRVMCVGGMGWNTTEKANKSNYGTKDDATSVEIYGPMCVWGLVDPANAGGDAAVKEVCGTSFSSPFVAGVAALVMAAKPSLNHQQVRDLLNQTAHTGGLGGEWWQGSDRRINAAKAVAKALRSGPSVQITAPTDKSEHSIGQSFGFKADGADYHGDPLPVQWASSIVGNLATPQTGTLAWPELPVGKHVISATAVDEFGDKTTDQITIEVVDEPAKVYIVAPTKNATYPAGTAIQLIGDTFDIDIPGQVPENETKWVVKRNGSKVHEAIGHQATLPAAKALAGNYMVEFSADGSTVTRPFKMVAPAPGQTLPTATITSPAQDVTLFYNGGHPHLTLAGSGTDAEDGSIPGTRYRWTATSQFSSMVLCTGSGVPGQGGKGKFGVTQDCSSVDAEMPYDGKAVGDTVWSVKLEVFDSTGLPAVDTVTVRVQLVVG